MIYMNEEPLIPKDKKEYGFLLIGIFIGIIINHLNLWMFWR